MPAITIHPRTGGRTVSELGPGLPRLFSTPSGLAILEVQGTINMQNVDASTEPIGRLSFPYFDASKGPDDTTWHKRVHLHIGQYQRLTGELKKLPKPLAILRKRSESTSTAADDGVGSESLEVVDVVYYKLLFASRPEPVGGSSQA